ncbi:MAG: molybdopterin-dependent oxidoreductase, partial [Pseudomonadales bacterium]|nr:molybdopterin-dependent oxidoreductase [Pseudomonadales bacterium]
LYQRITAARAQRPGMKIVVIDPRRSPTCDSADLHLALAPGSDAFIFSGLLHFLQQHGHLDTDYIAEHTEGFADSLACAPDLATVARNTALSETQLNDFYQCFANTEKTLTFYSQGINQSATGTDKCNAIINCHLATGRIGRPGMGPFSITGQPNAMGGREVGGLANQLAAHMDFTPDNVARLRRFWHSDRVATTPGLKAVDMFEAIARGDIKAVWIMATNPLVSLPDSDRMRQALQRCELVVVSDCIEKTDTTACATVLLPAAGWGEKDGTVTNSERCISRQRAFLPLPGEARPDWWMLTEVAARMGYGEHFNYTGAAAIFREHAALSGFENGRQGGPRRLFDISALADLSDQNYADFQPRRWPLPATQSDSDEGGPRRLFADKRFFTESGRAHFIAVTPVLPAAAVPVAPLASPGTKAPRPGTFPAMILNTGRVRDQWHTMTRSARSPRLLQHIDAPYVALHPQDARQVGVGDGDLLRVHNDQGGLVLQVKLDDAQRRNEVFVPIHWNDQFSSHGRVNRLLAARTDPWSGQPESKFARVALSPVETTCWVHLTCRSAVDVSQFDYWVAVPTAQGWRYQLALTRDGQHGAAEPLQWLSAWLQALSQTYQKIEFIHSARSDYRALFYTEAGIQLGVFARPGREHLPAARQMEELLQQPVDSQSWRLLNGPQARHDDRLVCSCHQVAEGAITGAIRAGADNQEELGRRLRCGTQCGSCIPELKQLIRRTLAEKEVEETIHAGTPSVIPEARPSIRHSRAGESS